jgi:hypothetical protein
MEEGPVSTCGRELIRGWWRPIGLMVSFVIFTASARNILNTPSYLVRAWLEWHPGHQYRDWWVFRCLWIHQANFNLMSPWPLRANSIPGSHSSVTPSSDAV